MKNHILRFVPFFIILCFTTSCLNTPPANRNVCNGEQGSFEFTADAETFVMEIQDNTSFRITESLDGLTTLSGSWHPNNNEDEICMATGYFFTHLIVGNYSFESTPENEPEGFGFSYTNMATLEVVNYGALNLSLDVSEATHCDPSFNVFCPIRASFSGDFVRRIVDAEGEETFDTIPGNGSFCLYETISK